MSDLRSSNSTPYAPNPNSIARCIDHTLLKATASDAEIIQLCKEAVQHQFFAVCVNGARVSFAAKQLAELSAGRPVSSPVVAAVVGFPLGQSTSAAKAFETERAIGDGAKEIDMVLRIDRAIAGDFKSVESDINEVVRACSGRALLKVILETCLLTDQQIQDACKASEAAGAQFVKTSTGFATPVQGRPSGATIEHVKLMAQTVGARLGVKASGGIRTRDFALQLIAAGATRIGASASVDLLTEGPQSLANASVTSDRGGSY